jgi:hypothetical protein
MGAALDGGSGRWGRAQRWGDTGHARGADHEVRRGGPQKMASGTCGLFLPSEREEIESKIANRAKYIVF